MLLALVAIENAHHLPKVRFTRAIKLGETMRTSLYDFSVILVVYNQPATLGIALKALLAQRFSGTFEIVISDDGSNESSFQRWRDFLDGSRIPIRYVWQQKRAFRAARARNNGIRFSSGRYLLFLDGDLIPALDLIHLHKSAHDRPNLLIAGNRRWRGMLDQSLPPASREKPIDAVMSILEEQTNTDDVSINREKIERERRRSWLRSAYPWRVCFSGNLSVAYSEEVLFDEGFEGWGLEDWEIAHRLYTKGYQPVYRDDITTYHVETPGASANVFRFGGHNEIVRYMKNAFRFAEKCPELPQSELFFGFSRFRLDQTSNTWSVIARHLAGTRQLDELIQDARQWLKTN